jgi:hypothetical protein
MECHEFHVDGSEEIVDSFIDCIEDSSLFEEIFPYA